MKKTLTYCDVCGKIITKDENQNHIWQGTLEFTWYVRTLHDNLKANDMCAFCTNHIKKAIETAVEECKDDPNRHAEFSPQR